MLDVKRSHDNVLNMKHISPLTNEETGIEKVLNTLNKIAFEYRQGLLPNTNFQLKTSGVLDLAYDLDLIDLHESKSLWEQAKDIVWSKSKDFHDPWNDYSESEKKIMSEPCGYDQIDHE